MGVTTVPIPTESLPEQSAAEIRVQSQIHRGELILAAMDYFLVHSMEVAAALDPDEIVEWITTAEFTLGEVYERQAAFSRDNLDSNEESILRLKAVLISKRHACEDFVDELWEIAENKYLEKYGSPWDDDDLEDRIKTTMDRLSESEAAEPAKVEEEEPFPVKKPVESEDILVSTEKGIVSVPSSVPTSDLRMCESCHRPMQISKMDCLGQLPETSHYQGVNANNWIYVCERAACHSWVQATFEKKMDLTHMGNRWIF